MIIVLLGVSVTLVPKVAIELAYLLKIDHHLQVNSKVSNFIVKIFVFYLGIHYSG